MFIAEFIYLEYSQVFGSLVSSLIAFKLTKNNLEIEEYLPLQICFYLLEDITNRSQYNLDIIIQKFGQQIHDFNESQITIALFPLILYHSQNLTQLEIELNLITQNLSLKPEQLDSIKIYIILVILITEKKLINENLFFNIKAKLEEVEEDNILFSNLELIKQLIEQKLTLLEIETKFLEIIKLDNLAIYQALYSFLSLPNNLEISLSRSSQFKYYQTETVVLTGFLLGLKNGYLTIPYQWRKTIEQEESVSKISILSDKLVAKWQGKLI